MAFDHGSEVPKELLNVILKTKSVCDGNEKLKQDSASAEAFFVLLQARQYWFEKLLCAARADIRHVPQPTSLFLWISHKSGKTTQAEDGIALFAFPNPYRADGKGASAFRTIDPDLIRTFEGIFEKLWSAKPNERVADSRR